MEIGENFRPPPATRHGCGFQIRFWIMDFWETSTDAGGLPYLISRCHCFLMETYIDPYSP